MKHQKHKKRRYRRNTVILTLSVILLFFVNSVLLTAIDFMNNSLNYVESRTLAASLVSYDYIDGELDEASYEECMQEKETLENYLNANTDILSYTRRMTYLIRSDEICDFQIFSEAYDYEAIQPYLLTEGCETLGEHEAVIAKYITKYDLESATAEDGWYDGEAFVGQTINSRIKVDDEYQDYELKIVGVYDNVAAGMWYGLLLSEDVLLGFEDVYMEGLKDSSKVPDSYFGEPVPQSYSTEYLIVVKERSDVAQVKGELSEIGQSSWTLEVIPSEEIYFFNSILAIANVLVIAMALNTTINTIYMTERDIRMRRREFGLLEAMGYREREVNWILVKEIGHISLVAVIVSLVVCVPGLLALNYCIDRFANVYLQAITISVRPSVLCLLIAIGFGGPAVGIVAAILSLRRIGAVGALKNTRE